MICLRWCIDQGVVAVTTSQKEQRMAEYLRVFEFKLTQEEVQEIAEKGSECLKEDLVPRVVQYYRRLRAQGAA
jgi:diketogulonate reductase-like aldo/keto reductase